MIVKNCLVCGVEFKTYPCKLRVGKGKYCSKECSMEIIGWKKGQHISPGTEIKKGTKPWSYKGFRYTKARKNGKYYKQIFSPEHPMADRNGYVREHRLVMATKLGRNLLKSEIVHHIDGNTLNNSPDNLEVMDKRDHDRMNVSLNSNFKWQKRGVV